MHVSERQIERMLEGLERYPSECVSEDIYRERLTSCHACPSLLYGTTCSHCGCIVRVRAKLSVKHCPNPGAPAW